jgi:hypothetical protein
MTGVFWLTLECKKVFIEPGFGTAIQGFRLKASQPAPFI